ncbi:MAG: putative collagen-binding domain-containing protein, partial [Candidatus Bathyarchaeia archaeon]
NDLDNVLYEIANESGTYSTDWQYHMIRYIHEYEKGKPKKHPVGMTFQWAREYRGTNKNLFNSPADWISPSPDDGYRDDPPAADGSKVILSDTDHLWGIGGNRAWVWKTFCRGMNPLFMDPYREVKKKETEGKEGVTWTDHLSEVDTLDPRWQPIRKNMGYTMAVAKRMNLAAMVPRSDLASTKYCLASPGVEYLIYLPEGGDAVVDLSHASGKLAVEWLDPSTGERRSGKPTAGGDRRELKSPFDGDAVLYVSSGK